MERGLRSSAGVLDREAASPTEGVGLSDTFNYAIRMMGGLEGYKVIAFSSKSTRASG